MKNEKVSLFLIWGISINLYDIIKLILIYIIQKHISYLLIDLINNMKNKKWDQSPHCYAKSVNARISMSIPTAKLGINAYFRFIYIT